MSVIIGSLEFTNDRLTISVSATCSSRVCGSPSSLACFPVKLILMPTHRDNPRGFGRVRTELLHQFRLDYPALLSSLAPRPKFFTIFYEALPDSKIRNWNFGEFCGSVGKLVKGVDGDGKMSLDEGNSRRSYDQEGAGLNITNFPPEPFLCESFSVSYPKA
jgi:hypothetical protein